MLQSFLKDMLEHQINDGRLNGTVKKSMIFYLEKMEVPFEKLEKLFFEKSSFLPPCDNIEKKLFAIFITALKSPDPVKVIQDNLDHYTGQYHGNKMIEYVAKSGNMNTFTATVYLKSKLADTYAKINH